MRGSTRFNVVCMKKNIVALEKASLGFECVKSSQCSKGDRVKERDQKSDRYFYDGEEKQEDGCERNQPAMALGADVGEYAPQSGFALDGFSMRRSGDGVRGIGVCGG